MPLTDEQKVNREATQKRIAEALENLMPLQAAPYVATIPTGQWSGSGSDYYITVTAANVTANSILIPQYDKDSAAQLRGAVWCVPGTGSFTIHTSAIPAGTVSIMVMFAGTMGEAQYQVLADVYSKSQTDAAIAQSAAKQKAISGRTDETGDISLSLNAQSSIPFAFLITGGNVPKTAARVFIQGSGGSVWWVKFVTDSTMTNIADTSVEGTVYYFDV